jgi:hypothetical protein
MTITAISKWMLRVQLVAPTTVLMPLLRGTESDASAVTVTFVLLN